MTNKQEAQKNIQETLNPKAQLLVSFDQLPDEDKLVIMALIIKDLAVEKIASFAGVPKSEVISTLHSEASFLIDRMTPERLSSIFKQIREGFPTAKEEK